jgi:hypothetical protein
MAGCGCCPPVTKTLPTGKIVVVEVSTRPTAMAQRKRPGRCGYTQIDDLGVSRSRTAGIRKWNGRGAIVPAMDWPPTISTLPSVVKSQTNHRPR